MLQAYFESVKYVGHLLPVSFLRIFVGYYYVNAAFLDWKIYSKGGNAFSEMMIDALNKAQIPSWYRIILSEQMIPNWNIVVFLLIGFQLAVGISYILGYVVRPMSVIAILLCVNFLILANTDREIFFKLLIACHVLLAWVGAGRCLGLDYYFFKRRRGVWW